MVTGTTLRSGPASIITGVDASPKSSPASAPRNSVWPGNSKPTAFSAFFWIGLVTTADALPLRTSIDGVANRTDHGWRVGGV